MTSQFLLRLQPAGAAAIDDLGEVAAEAEWNGLIVSVAYATRAGVMQMVGELAERWQGFWPASKLFVVGLDFGLTEPGAIRYLDSLPNAACHLHEARQTLSAALRPQSRYHPKLYAFASGSSIKESYLSSGIVGSANLTGSGLTSNFEAYARFRAFSATASGRSWLRQLTVAEEVAKAQLRATESLLSEYEELRNSMPVTTVRAEATPGRYEPLEELDQAHLRALRAARCLWTQTLKIVENRGSGKAGNQVDLKRGARVFFRSQVPLSAPRNTPLGSILVMAGPRQETCNLRYGNNGMDKVNLPVPGEDNPLQYDNSFVLWERRDDNSYLLRVEHDGTAWVRASEEEGTRFMYANGQRVWGFFSAAPL